MARWTEASREEYPTRKIRLVGDAQRALAHRLIDNAPIDPVNPLEFVIREEVKARKKSQNDLMWAGPLADIAEQAYVNGRTYAAKVWHEYFKELFLPEEFDPAQCREGYQKWDYKPDGSRLLVGSTTKLTRKGFARYLTQVEAHAANEFGVVFTANPRQEAA